MAEWKESALMYQEDIKGCPDVLDTYKAIKKYQQDVLARSDAKEYLRKMIEQNKEKIDEAEESKIN